MLYYMYIIDINSFYKGPSETPWNHTLRTKAIESPLTPLLDLYDGSCPRRDKRIMEDKQHPENSLFEIMQTGA